MALQVGAGVAVVFQVVFQVGAVAAAVVGKWLKGLFAWRAKAMTGMEKAESRKQKVEKQKE